jgi:hypothetical protein
VAEIEKRDRLGSGWFAREASIDAFWTPRENFTVGGTVFLPAAFAGPLGTGISRRFTLIADNSAAAAASCGASAAVIDGAAVVGGVTVGDTGVCPHMPQGMASVSQACSSQAEMTLCSLCCTPLLICESKGAGVGVRASADTSLKYRSRVEAVDFTVHTINDAQPMNANDENVAQNNRVTASRGIIPCNIHEGVSFDRDKMVRLASIMARH